MAIEALSSGTSSSGPESFSFTVDYDTTAQTIGLTCSGTGHGTLTVARTSNGAVLGSLNCDQYGTTTGTLTNGASDGPVTYTGQRVIVLGPGATGVDSTGAPLSTQKVSAAVVGALTWQGSTPPGLGITLSWRPNVFSASVA